MGVGKIIVGGSLNWHSSTAFFSSLDSMVHGLDNSLIQGLPSVYILDHDHRQSWPCTLGSCGATTCLIVAIAQFSGKYFGEHW